MRIKVKETRIGYIDVKPENYPEGERDMKSIMRIERENASEHIEYMDMIDASSELSMIVVD